LCLFIIVFANVHNYLLHGNTNTPPHNTEKYLMISTLNIHEFYALKSMNITSLNKHLRLY